VISPSPRLPLCSSLLPRIDPSRYLQYLPTERVAPTLSPATLSKAEPSVGSEVVSSSQYTNGSVSHSRSSLQMSLSLSADPAPATEHELFPPPPPSAPPSPLETHDSRPETPPPLRLFVSTTPPSCEVSYPPPSLLPSSPSLSPLTELCIESSNNFQKTLLP
jgi:hypothetical protein